METPGLPDWLDQEALKADLVPMGLQDSLAPLAPVGIQDVMASPEALDLLGFVAKPVVRERQDYLDPLDPVEKLDLPVVRGLLVHEVHQGSPAEQLTTLPMLLTFVSAVWLRNSDPINSATNPINVITSLVLKI